MPVRNITSKQYVNKLVIMHSALLMGQAFFGGVAGYLTYAQQIKPVEDNTIIWLAGAMGLSFIVFIASSQVFVRRLNSLRALPDLASKLKAYQTAFLIRLALLESGTLFAVVAMILTGDLNVCFLIGALVLSFAMIRPTRERITAQINMDHTELDKFSNPDAVVLTQDYSNTPD